MPTNESFYYFAAGVFIINHRAADLPDLLAVAREWLGNDNFCELVVRRVSERDCGIQFVYMSTDYGCTRIKKYQLDLVTRFGATFCSSDFCEYDSSGDCAKPFEGLVRLRASPVSHS